MKRTICVICAVLALTAVNPSRGMIGGTALSERPRSPVTPEESSRVIATLKSRGIEMYRKYKGVESLRSEIIKEYAPVTGALKSTSEVTSRRRDYFYKDPEIEILSYKKDGKELEPSKFRIMRSSPSYPVFDGQGDEHYSVIIEDTVRINGKACYRVQVNPKKKTMRHFSGELFIRKDTLESVRIEGTVARLDFPLTSFRIELAMVPLDNVPVVQSGMVEVRVNVPVFYPDTLLVTSVTVLENRLMQ